jgi:LEA14-like dessication related protein
MHRSFTVIVASLILFISGCSIIEMILGTGRIKEPVVKVESVDFGNVSFESLELLFNIMIDNPNQLRISLSSFDYELLLNDISFVKGDRQDGMHIDANARSSVQIPVSLTFDDIIASVRTVARQDTSSYRFTSGLTFALPVLGDVRIPVQKSGELPVVKTPTVNVSHFKINNISFTGADATLALTVNNPNSFSLGLRDMHYNFVIDGINVLSGSGEKNISINRTGESRIEIPVSINFVDFGQAIYGILRGEQKARFRFFGSATFDSSLDFFRNLPLNFDQSGELPLIR